MAGVIRQNKLQKIDTFLFYKCNFLSSEKIKQASYWLSKTGDGYAYAALGLLIWAVEPVVGQIFFLTALLAFAFELPIYLLLKNTFKRNRPFNILENFSSYIAPSDKFSMPSGHTAAAFVFATVCAHFYPDYTPILLAWACGIGLSRVLLGVHFPGDVIAGCLLGCACAELAITLSQTGF